MAPAQLMFAWAAAATCGSQAGAFIYSSHAGSFCAGRSLSARSPSSARCRVDIMSCETTCSHLPRMHRKELRRPPQHLQRQQLPPRFLRPSSTRLRALPEDTGVDSGTRSSAPAPDPTETEGAGGGRRRQGAAGAGAGAGTGTGLDGQFISKLARRLADSFPLLTADEIKNEVRRLLNPETKGEANKVREMFGEKRDPGCTT